MKKERKEREFIKNERVKANLKAFGESLNGSYYKAIKIDNTNSLEQAFKKCNSKNKIILLYNEKLKSAKSESEKNNIEKAFIKISVYKNFNLVKREEKKESLKELEKLLTTILEKYFENNFDNIKLTSKNNFYITKEEKTQLDNLTRNIYNIAGLKFDDYKKAIFSSMKNGLYSK